MVVCGVYLRETRQPLTHKDSVVVYQIVVSYLLYMVGRRTEQNMLALVKHTTQEGCGAGSC